jgi:hypothetical protein
VGNMTETEFVVDINSPDFGVVNALTPKGVALVLVADPDDGDYLVVERIPFFGAESEWVAYKLGPGDVPRPEYTRFAVLTTDAVD